jgi:TM2 domain-containing membrane protein YozV
MPPETPPPPDHPSSQELTGGAGEAMPAAHPGPQGEVRADQLARMLQAEAYSAGQRKEAGIAYLLWFFLGGFGGHRFYLGKTGSAIGMLCLTVISLPFTVLLVGFAGLFAVGVWCLVDLFLISGWVRSHNEETRRAAYRQV